jgi:hypothetical protein
MTPVAKSVQFQQSLAAIVDFFAVSFADGIPSEVLPIQGSGSLNDFLFLCPQNLEVETSGQGANDDSIRTPKFFGDRFHVTQSLVWK